MVADAADWMDDPLTGIGACLADAINDVSYATMLAQDLALLGLARRLRQAHRMLEIAQYHYRRTVATAQPAPAATEGK